MAVPTEVPVGPVNLYLLEGEPLTLIDTGPNSPHALMALEGHLSAQGYRLADIELLVLTHEHPDHMGLAAAVAERSGAVVAGHPSLVGDLGDYDAFMDREDALVIELLLRHGFEASEAEIATGFMRSLNVWGTDVEVGRPLENGTTLDAGGRQWRVLHRPGHSVSDLVLHEETSGTLIAGDHLLPEISTIAAMTHPLNSPGGDRCQALTALRESLAATRELEPMVALPGHGPVIAEPVALIDRRFEQQRQRAARLLELLGGSTRTARDLAEMLFPGNPPEQGFLTTIEVLGHLDLLIEHGDVVESVDDVVRFQRS